MELHGTSFWDHHAFLAGNTTALTDEEKSARRVVYGALLAVSGSILIIAATVAVQMKKGWPWCKACASCCRSLSQRCRGAGQPQAYTQVPLVPAQDAAGEAKDAEHALAADVPEATPEEAKEVDAKVLDSEKNLRSSNEKFVRMRHLLLTSLFVFYVSCSAGLPYFNASQASCINGFFWEDHMPFLILFLVTKSLELIVYVNDPTIAKAQLGWFSFMKTFVLSFLGYCDAYTDATAIVITATCPADGAELLAKWMMGFYVIGVIIGQWMVAFTMAWCDETHVCLMKLIHWDACASCIALPLESKSAWMAVNLARTFLEDIPQAVLQSIFLLCIRPNPFMLISVAIGVCSSVKGVVDAAQRGVAAAATLLEALGEVRRGAEDEAKAKEKEAKAKEKEAKAKAKIVAAEVEVKEARAKAQEAEAKAKEAAKAYQMKAVAAERARNMNVEQALMEEARDEMAKAAKEKDEAEYEAQRLAAQAHQAAEFVEHVRKRAA